MINPKKFYREIPPLSSGDSFLVFDRVKDDFDFPVHYHPEFEINFIQNGSGVKRVVGDNIEDIDAIELVLVGPNLYHGWELNKCKNDKIHEITIQFHNDLFDESLLSRKIMSPIKDMFQRSIHGILFSKKTAEECRRHSAFSDRDPSLPARRPNPGIQPFLTTPYRLSAFLYAYPDATARLMSTATAT